MYSTSYSNSRVDNERIEVFCVDMNGIPRGKWVPASQLDNVLDGKPRLPLSTQSLDIWGEDNDALTGLSQSIGDPDGICHPDQGTLKPLLQGPGQQLLTTLYSLVPVTPFVLSASSRKLPRSMVGLARSWLSRIPTKPALACICMSVCSTMKVATFLTSTMEPGISNLPLAA